MMEFITVIVIISVIIIVTISQPYAGEDHLDDYDRDGVHHHLYNYHCHHHQYACHILIITSSVPQTFERLLRDFPPYLFRFF